MGGGDLPQKKKTVDDDSDEHGATVMIYLCRRKKRMAVMISPVSESIPLYLIYDKAML